MSRLTSPGLDSGATLLSLCEFRLRAGKGAIPEHDEDYEPLASVIREVGRELSADGILVAWHAEEREPVFLFASGDCQPQSLAEDEMLQVAREATSLDHGNPVRWAEYDQNTGAGALLTTSIAVSGGIVTVTTLFRRISGTAKVGVRNAAMRMLPMVQGFFRLWSLRARALVVNRGLMAALNSSAVPTVMVDAAGRLTFANEAAEHLLAKGDGLRRTGAMIGGMRFADTIRLQASIEHVINGDDPANTPSPVIALHRRSGRPLLAAIIPVARATRASNDSAAIVHVFDPDNDLETMLAPVCRVYALSPVESRLALLLSRGMPLVEAAKQMRVQEQSARTYLKQVFAKTGTNRQAELVWLMLKSAVRTAPSHLTRFD